MSSESITLPLGALVAAQPALARLGEQALPMRQAYQVAKVIRLVQHEVEIFHQQRQALIRELGDERDATDEEQAAGHVGRVMQVPPARWGVFVARLSELAAVEVTLPIGPIALEGDRVITPRDLADLGPLVADA